MKFKKPYPNEQGQQWLFNTRAHERQLPTWRNAPPGFEPVQRMSGLKNERQLCVPVHRLWTIIQELPALHLLDIMTRDNTANKRQTRCLFVYMLITPFWPFSRSLSLSESLIISQTVAQHLSLAQKNKLCFQCCGSYLIKASSSPSVLHTWVHRHKHPHTQTIWTNTCFGYISVWTVLWP